MEEKKATEVRGRMRRVIFVVTACLLLALGVVAIWPRQREPEYDGKKLSEWLDICRNHGRGKYGQSQSLESAQEAVRKIGTNGLPWLVQWTSQDTPKWKSALISSKYSRWIPRPMMDLMVRPIFQSQRAQEGFSILGTVASPAIPELVRMTDRWPAESSINAIWAIRDIDAEPDALSALIGVATNRSKPFGIRQRAMEAVGTLRPVETNESWVVPAILSCLAEDDMARSTIIGIASFIIPPDIGVPVMKKATGSRDAEVRVWAIVALGRYGTEASPAIPELLRALNDYDPRVQQEAADALKVVAPEMLPERVKDF